jgi:hypothetical protein
VVAAIGYGILCRRLNLRTLLVGCMIFATAANLGYVFYSSAGRAQAIEGLNGFGYTLAELALMDLAVRSTPAGSRRLWPLTRLCATGWSGLYDSPLEGDGFEPSVPRARNGSFWWKREDF